MTTLLGVGLSAFSVMQLKRKFMRAGRAFDYRVTTEVVDRTYKVLSPYYKRLDLIQNYIRIEDYSLN